MNGWRDTESEGVESRENMKKKKGGVKICFYPPVKKIIPQFLKCGKLKRNCKFHVFASAEFKQIL